MHKTQAETRAFIDALLAHVARLPDAVRVAIAPPFTALATARAALAGQTRIALGAQTMHWEEQGAYTGEISPPMLEELGVAYVIVGHSERRASCGELDRTVNLKTKAALAHGITPIVAVGETLQEREANETDARVISQTRHALDGIATHDLQRVVLAYEPIWAIGTGRNCDPKEANRVMGTIRHAVAGLHDTPILYGGSMKAENAASYMRHEHINGGLIGGASLDPSSFIELIINAAPA